MSIQEQLTQNLKDAMRAQDKPQINVIRQIQTEVTVKKSAPGFEGEVDDDLYLSTIAGYVKKMSKAKAEFESAGERGAEQAGKLAYEIEYLSQWLPDESENEEEARRVVKAAIAELGIDDPKQTGRLMGHIMKSSPGLDGAIVNRIVKEELGA